MRSKLRNLTGAFIAGTMCISSTVATAAVTPASAVPKSSVVAACASTTAAAGAAAAQAAARPGCVLPAVEPAVVTTTQPVMTPMLEEGGGFNLWLPLLGLAAVVGAVLLLRGDDDGEGSLSAG